MQSPWDYGRTLPPWRVNSNEAGVEASPTALGHHTPPRTFARPFARINSVIRGVARELGVRKDDVIRLVKKWDIPKRSRDQRNNPFARLDVELSPAMQAVSRTRNSVQCLRHLIVTSRHRTLQDAAAELGVTWGTLNYQLKRVEETVASPSSASADPGHSPSPKLLPAS